MKKLLYILAICLCLNGVALASETDPAPEPPAQAEPSQPQAGPAAPAEPAAPAATQQEAPAQDAPSEGGAEQQAPEADAPGNAGAQEEGRENPEAAEPVEGGQAADAPQDPESPEGTGDAQDPADQPAEVRRVLAADMADDALKAAVEGVTKGEKIYVNADKDRPVCLKAAALATLSEAEFLPDEAAYKDKACAVRFATADPAKAEKTYESLKALMKDADAETADLWVWVEKPAEAAEEKPAGSNPGGEESAETPVTVQVSCEGFTSGTWMTTWPVFRLSGIPEGKKWDYAAVIYDERIALLSGDSYVPEQEGVFALRFAIVDELGDFVSASEKYTVMLDCTPPDDVTIAIDETAEYTLNIAASDSISGVTALSMDGGVSWTDMEDGGVFVYAAGGPQTVPAGAIRVRDAAGNVFESTQDYVLEKNQPEPEPDYPGYYGGGGGGGESGEKKPAKTHASGSGEDSGEYEALRLQLPEDPMTQLTIDGEPLALTLALTAAEGPGAALGEEQPFSAGLAHWTPAPLDDEETGPTPAADDPDALNTLVLTAEPEANLGDRFTYEWRFNGEVYRLLANSGIRYVALRVGDDVAAFPTEGFTGGTKYTELKMLGVSTRRFDYTLTMKVNLDPGYVSALSDSDYSLDCDLSIRAEVENMAYELSSSTRSVMYFYDVYLGPADMLDQPFGAYRANDNA